MKKILVIFYILLWIISYCWAGKLKCTDIHIVDGDTVRVMVSNGTITQQVKVRLAGIDTPEKYYTAKLYKDAKRCRIPPKQMHELGLLATCELYELLYKHDVYLDRLGIGKYRRVIGILYLKNGTNINYEMVKSGYACVYRYKLPNLTDDQWKVLRSCQEYARLNKKGLWAIDYDAMSCLCGYSE